QHEENHQRRMNSHVGEVMLRLDLAKDKKLQRRPHDMQPHHRGECNRNQGGRERKEEISATHRFVTRREAHRPPARSQSVNSRWLTARIRAFIWKCEMPHNSAHAISYSPARSRCTYTGMFIPGMASCLNPRLGAKKLWITSSDRSFSSV